MKAGTTVEAHAWVYTEVLFEGTESAEIGTDYLHVSFVARDEKEAAVLTLSLPDLPECYGKRQPTCPLVLPVALPMETAKFTRMHELQGRRAEININFNLDNCNVHVTLTTDNFPQLRESDQVDLLYLQMLKWFKKIANADIVFNKYQYASIPGDAPKNSEELEEMEINREKLTRESLKLPEELFPEIDLEFKENMREPNTDKEQLAKATLAVLRSLRSFTRHMGKLANKVPVDSKSWLLELVESFNSPDTKKNYLQPPKRLLQILMDSDSPAVSPASIIQTLCRAVDKETGRQEKNTEKIKDNTISRADGPFALRVANKLRCERCGRFPPEDGSKKDLKSFVRTPFLKISPPRHGSIAAAIRDSMRALSTFEEKLIDCVRCNSREAVLPVGSFASNPKSIPKILLLDINNADRIVFEEPEWLALDALKYNENNADIRRTNMSIEKVGRILENDPNREYSYKLHAVIREFNGNAGVEIYDGREVTRVAVGQKWVSTSEVVNNAPPTMEEKKLAKLLVYVRTGLLEEADVEIDSMDDAGFETAVEENKTPKGLKLADFGRMALERSRTQRRGRGRGRGGRRGAERRVADAAKRGGSRS